MLLAEKFKRAIAATIALFFICGDIVYYQGVFVLQ